MASQTESPVPAPAAHVVGNAFVDQYYKMLHHSPESVYKFYQDLSMLSRPEPNGVMTSVTTMLAINEKIISLDYKNYKTEIKTADAQDSHMGGVIVLVTGCLTGTDNVRRKFTQTFYLAPQDRGYFVLNDVFRYVDENEPMEIYPALVNGIGEDVPTAPLMPEPEPSQATDRQVLDLTGSPSEENIDNGEEVCNNPLGNDEGSDIEDDGEPDAHSGENEVQPVDDSPSVVKEDSPKKSYASIVKVMKDSTASSVLNVSTTTVRVAPRNIEQSIVSSASASIREAPATSTNGALENDSIHEDVEGHSIYIGRLPLNATVSLLEEEFKKFGPIKPDGIQVRSSKPQGFCFGFVEFESSSSVRSAIEASPIMIGNREAFVEEKKTSRGKGGGGGGRGRFPAGRGSFRNDSFRARGNFAGRGYGRNDFGNRGDYSGRNRGSSGRSSDGYQRVDQNGNGTSG